MLFRSNATTWATLDASGNLGIGTAPSTGNTIYVGKSLTGAINVSGVASFGQVQSDVTSTAAMFKTNPSTQAAAFTLSSMFHFHANQSTIGAGSTVTNQYGFVSDSSLIGATNNYGFYSNIASGTGRYNFFANGTAANFFAGLTGVGTTAIGGYNGTFSVGGSGSQTSGFLEGIHSNMAIPSTVTVRHDAFLSTPYTVAASFTLANLTHYAAQSPGFGAGSTVTTQVGFRADSSLIGATNN